MKIILKRALVIKSVVSTPVVFLCGFGVQSRDDTFLYPSAPRPALGYTSLQFQWKMGSCPREQSGRGVDVTNHYHLEAQCYTMTSSHVIQAWCTIMLTDSNTVPLATTIPKPLMTWSNKYQQFRSASITVTNLTLQKTVQMVPSFGCETVKALPPGFHSADTTAFTSTTTSCLSYIFKAKFIIKMKRLLKDPAQLVMDSNHLKL